MTVSPGRSDEIREVDSSLLDKMLKKFEIAGGKHAFFSEQRNEAVFDFVAIKEHIGSAKRCLEVGASGLLACPLAQKGVAVDALEPLSEGFANLDALLKSVESLQIPNLTIIRSKIEDFETQGEYEFIYSIRWR